MSEYLNIYPYSDVRKLFLNCAKSKSKPRTAEIQINGIETHIGPGHPGLKDGFAHRPTKKSVSDVVRRVQV